MNLAILASLMSAFLFGIANTLQKPVIAKLGVLNLIIIRGLILSFITLVLVLVNNGFFNIKLIDLLFAILVSIVSYIAYYFFCLALDLGKASVIIPVSSSRIVFITIFSYLFFQQEIRPLQYVFMLLIFSGVVLISGNFNELRKSIFEKSSLLALLAGIIWGVSFPFFGYYSKILGVYTFTFVLEITVALSALIQLIIFNRSNKLDFKLIIKKEILPLVLIIGVFGAIGSMLSNYAYGNEKMGIVGSIGGGTILISVIFSKYYLKEKINMQRVIASIIILGGIIGISLF